MVTVGNFMFRVFYHNKKVGRKTKIHCLCLWTWNSLGKKTRVGSHSLLQGIFLTQGSNTCFLCLLHWQVGSLPLQFSSVQSLSRVRLFATPWITARQAYLSITNWSLPKLMSSKSMMSSSHLILWWSLLLLPAMPPSVRVFSNESTLCMRWPKY